MRVIPRENGWLVSRSTTWYLVVNPHPGQYLCQCIGFMNTGHCIHVKAVKFGQKLVPHLFELEDISGIGPAYKAKLMAAGITDILILASKNQFEVAEALGITDTQAQKIVDQAINMAASASKFEDAFEDFTRIKITRGHVSTGSPELDKIIDPCSFLPLDMRPKYIGGFETFAVNSIWGPFGSSKSQLCHQVAVTAQLGQLAGGLKTGDRAIKVAYIETESGTFRHERIVQMAQAMKLDAESILRNIILIRAFTVEEQYAAIRKVALNARQENIRVLIIDSFSARFREVYTGRETFSARAKELVKHLQFVNKMAFEENMCVLLTHQVYGSPVAFAKQINVWGGHMVKHVATLHIMVTKEASGGGDKPDDIPWAKIKCEVVDHPAIPVCSTIFYITPSGVRDGKDT